MIRFEQVTCIFPDGTRAVDGLSLEVARGETLMLVGTSGSGKTTALKTINRLIEPTAGRVMIDGRDAAREDPIALRRRIGYAIQEIGLFGHMTVAENIAVGPRLAGQSKSEIERRVGEMLEMVGLAEEGLRDRFPAELSGGQRQRVGVARALAADPPIVLMDEPFGALDPITREQMQAEFAALQARLRKTVIFVTHDIAEAIRLGDRIAALDGGRLQQVGSAREIVERPANAFVERFLGRHRFQLSLMTRPIRSLIEPSSEEPQAPQTDMLDAGDSMLAALDAFKRTGREALSVREEGRPCGALRRSRLAARIAAILGESEEEA